MTHKVRVILRFIIAIISVGLIIFYQRRSGSRELMIMLVALGGLLWSLYDYNRDYTHPKREE